MSLDGASVLVTGGTRGIGLAIAQRLIRDGAKHAVLGYLRNDSAAEAAAKQLDAEVTLVRGNVADEKTVAELAAGGPYKVVVHNAATGVVRPALESVARYLAVELAPRIRVNTVSAGVVETEALEFFPNKDEMLRSVERTPAGRLVEPADVAAAVSFLASDDASMIRGQTLVIDGGFSLRA